MASPHVLIPAFSKVLPAEFRERVFEPAFADLVVAESDIQGKTQGPLLRLANRVLFTVNCLRLGVPQIFWYRERPTRVAGRVAATLVVVVLVLFFLTTRITYETTAGVN